MMPPFNAPSVDESGFYVPFYRRIRSGRVQPAPFVSQFATIIAKPRGGQRADALGVDAAPPGRESGSESAALFRRHA